MNRALTTLALGAALSLAACSEADKIAAPEAARFVRVAVVEAAPALAPVTLAGRIEAEDVASLAFRLNGRLKVRPVRNGDFVEQGQVLAELEPQDEENTLRSARADLVAAEGRLVEARNHYERRRELLRRDVVSRADFEMAEQAFTAARAQVDAASARLAKAEELLGFTVLRADAPGIVTAIGAEPGEFVRAGQMVVRLARRDGRDAVFDVPSSVLDRLSGDAIFFVALAADAGARAIGRVREVSPQADPVTRTFQVRVGLKDPPASFRLGSAVTGTLEAGGEALHTVPVAAIVEGLEPAVWVVDPATSSVALRKVGLIRTDPVRAFVATGLKPGEIVVTAGTASLSPGQVVRVPGGET